jgi:N-acetylglutamate synthase-like GNAT family acetyltransferase
VTEPVLRRATAADVDAITALVAEAFARYVDRIGKPPAPMLADYATLLGVARIWVLETADESKDDAPLVAMIVIVPHTDHVVVETVAVAPGAQGGGHGRRLLERAEHDAAELGVAEVRLSTNEAMTENLAYYPRRGYVETGRGLEDGYRRVFFSRTINPLGDLATD